ncbi:hypothetical protein [Verrucosispora sp. WMMC514]|uniref:hypothetical protein n=1 Tax=Verrucosispora sp. WMMC514 TaxID=3015156 RepID=UPI00248BE957|nr:hypothetical protein [Verrucosispora sp. WMMC514]WBB89226.1 hypothetical protein O7597_19635 [Verrucosispora sp. WMMC514]
MAGDRTGPVAFRRIPPILRPVVLWAAATPLAVGFRLLFRDPWAEAVLAGAMFVLFLLPAWLWASVQPQSRAKQPTSSGAGPVPDAVRRQHERDRRRADEQALNRALRTGEPPEDESLRAELPAYLRWRVRGAALALVTGLPLLAGLILLGWHGGVERAWPVMYALFVPPLAGWAGWVLVRAGRLGRRLNGDHHPHDPAGPQRPEEAVGRSA